MLDVVFDLHEGGLDVGALEYVELEASSCSTWEELSGREASASFQLSYRPNVLRDGYTSTLARTDVVRAGGKMKKLQHAVNKHAWYGWVTHKSGLHTGGMEEGVQYMWPLTLTASPAPNTDNNGHVIGTL